MFFNLIFIVLIFNFFSKPFCKSYYSFQFNPSIKILFLFFMSMLILILLIFLILLLNWFFFNFILQSNIKFILYLNFDL
jgi:hypothetical protein